MKHKMWRFGVDPLAIDAISLQTSSPSELVGHLLYLREHPRIAKRIRHEARRTAAGFTWRQVILTHIAPMLSSYRNLDALPTRAAVRRDS